MPRSRAPVLFADDLNILQSKLPCYQNKCSSWVWNNAEVLFVIRTNNHVGCGIMLKCFWFTSVCCDSMTSAFRPFDMMVLELFFEKDA